MKPLTVGDYLLNRLHEMGIEHLFGVPGDFNLQFLDDVIAHPAVRWVGCANELNAAYAADGYGRRRKAAALLTTFGVGELSAINGIAGSFAEYVPVVHITGAPSLAAQQAGDLIHHTLGDGDFSHFARMQREVTCAQAQLTRDNPEAEIDRVLREVLRQRRPGYLMLPVDVAAAPAQLPTQPLHQPQDTVAPALRAAFRDAAEPLLASASRVSLLVDFLADRFDVLQQVTEWLAMTPLPHATLLMGKGALNEQHPAFVGTYAGSASTPEVRRAIEEVDVTLTLGVRFTDTLTAGFTQQLPVEKSIDLQPFACSVAGQPFALPMQIALAELRQLCEKYAQQWAPPPQYAPRPAAPVSGTLCQKTLWQLVQAFIQPGDVILADQGTAAFGAADLRLPQGAQLITQPLWGSIGYTLPATLGAQTAEPDRRVILLVGDGSAQLTIQELGSMMRDGLHPLIFVLNNNGYTVERAIHGADQRYNDIAAWNWTQLPQAMSLACPVQSWQVSETAQLQQVMALIAPGDRMSLVEVLLPQQDLPPLLKKVTASLHQRNCS